MAISDGTAGDWVATTTRNPTVTLPTHAAGDMLLVRIGWKSATPTTDVAVCNTSGWAKIGQFYDGNGASSNGGGGVLVAVFWKVAASSSETDPTIEFDDATAPTPGAYCAVTYTKGASDVWLTPVGDGGAFAASTSISATIQSHVTATAGDMIDAFSVVDDNNVMTVPTFTQSGVTFDTVTEYPATALNSGTSNDIAADGCNRLATAGTSSAAAVVTGTQNVGDTGASWTTRLRVQTVTTVPGSFTADAVIKANSGTKTFTADAVVKRTYTFTTLTADAAFAIHTESSITATAVIKKTWSGLSVTADAIAKANSGTKTLTADAVIQWSQQGSYTADAVLARTVTDTTLTATAVIKALIDGLSFTADASILVPRTDSLTVDANIFGTVTMDFTADARLGEPIQYIPTWVSPADTTEISVTPVLVLEMPVDMGKDMFFHIQLDKADTFDTADLRDIKSNLDLAGWEYWNNSTWEAIPASGVPSTYGGNQARHTVQVPLSTGTWYRRVRAG